MLFVLTRLPLADCINFLLTPGPGPHHRRGVLSLLPAHSCQKREDILCSVSVPKTWGHPLLSKCSYLACKWQCWTELVTAPREAAGITRS